jgi:large repetitive protein
MSIAATQGNATNSSSSVSSLAFASLTTVSGRDIVFVITLGSTSSSVSSITASAGSYGTFTFRAAQNGTGVRVEIWTVHVVTGAATVFTVNITGGATSLSIQQEEYSGVSSIGHTSTASGSSFDIRAGNVLTQDSTNIVVAGLGFACQSGDTLTAQNGGERQKSIPAATAVGGCLQDHTTILVGTVAVMTQINNSRNWAAAALELRSGITANAAGEYASGTAPALSPAKEPVGLSLTTLDAFALAPVSFVPSPVGTNLAGGTTGVAYSETISGAGGTAPYTFAVVSGSLPTSTTLNSTTGVISGTPTVAGTYNFTIRVTDVNGYTGSHLFQIIISAPSSSGGGSYTFLN